MERKANNIHKNGWAKYTDGSYGLCYGGYLYGSVYEDGLSWRAEVKGDIEKKATLFDAKQYVEMHYERNRKPTQ